MTVQAQHTTRRRETATEEPQPQPADQRDEQLAETAEETVEDIDNSLAGNTAEVETKSEREQAVEEYDALMADWHNEKATHEDFERWARKYAHTGAVVVEGCGFIGVSRR